MSSLTLFKTAAVFFPSSSVWAWAHMSDLVQRISRDVLTLPSLFRRSSKVRKGGVRDVVQQPLHLIHSRVSCMFHYWDCTVKGELSGGSVNHDVHTHATHTHTWARTMGRGQPWWTSPPEHGLDTWPARSCWLLHLSGRQKRQIEYFMWEEGSQAFHSDWPVQHKRTRPQ